MNARRQWRFKFGLRTLLASVAIAAVGLYCRPGQVAPQDVPLGATKAWVYWNCGKPKNGYYDRGWAYVGDVLVIIRYDSGGRVERTFTYEDMY
jgi:hypothetical protein